MRSRNQPRLLTVIVFGILALAFVAVGPAFAEGQEKVTICHHPPGNPENAQTIVVGAPAVIAHVALHDDTIGPCEGDDNGGGSEA